QVRSAHAPRKPSAERWKSGPSGPRIRTWKEWLPRCRRHWSEATEHLQIPLHLGSALPDGIECEASATLPGARVKYDDASWHYGADNFPKDLSESSGATHIGMFVAWAILSGLAGELHIEESRDSMNRLQQRTITPAGFFLKECDWKFTDE